MRDTRTDSGQFYPGGKVLPRQPGGGGGGTVVLDDTVTEASANGVKSIGIWAWVKSLFPSWLTANYAEPATVASVISKYTKPSGGIPKTDLAEDVKTSLGKADSALQQHQDISGKRDKTDRVWGERTFSEWTFTAEQEVADAIPSNPHITIEPDDEYGYLVYMSLNHGWTETGPQPISGPYALQFNYQVQDDTGEIVGYIHATRTETTDKLALLSDIPTVPTAVPYLRVYDEQSQCWWRGVMRGGVLNWEVEEEN